MNRHFVFVMGLCLVLAFIGVAGAQAQTCAPAWSSSTAYNGGAVVSKNCGGNKNFTANWWTQGNDPCTSSGPSGSGQPWAPGVACGGSATATATTATRATATATTATRATATATARPRVTATPTPTTSGGGGTCAPAWVSSVAYNGGAQVSRVCGGTNQKYQAAFWTQGNDPCTSSGVAGSGQPWIPLGSCTQATATATVPPTATPTTCSGCTGGTGGAPYSDISLATGSQVASNASAAGLKAITLAFLVDGGCQATWGGGLGNVSSAMFPNGTSVKSQIDALTAAGRKVYISWGGASGSALSSCGSASAAQAMYQQAFTAYPNIAGQDFDIEGGVNATMLCQAMAGLQAANPSKTLSLTLPVLPTGLVSAGLTIVNACHSAGIHPLVNVMAMDYGSANDNGGNMLLSAQQAAQNTRNQTGDNIGITPMIGLNDTNTETFTLSNASGLVSWAKGQAYVKRLAFWSLSRDNGGCPGQTFASPTCSGVSQSTWQFSSIFNGF